MKQDWSEEELIEHWTLEPCDYQLLANRTGTTRLGFAIQLKYFQLEAQFPNTSAEIPITVVAFLAKQLQMVARTFSEYDLQSRSATYHRQQIREKFGFREATVLDQEAAINWLVSEVLPFETNLEDILVPCGNIFVIGKLNRRHSNKSKDSQLRQKRGLKSPLLNKFINDCQ